MNLWTSIVSERITSFPESKETDFKFKNKISSLYNNSISYQEKIPQRRQKYFKELPQYQILIT